MSDNRKYCYLKLKKTSTTAETMVIWRVCRMACFVLNLLLKCTSCHSKAAVSSCSMTHLPHAPDHRHLYPPSGGDGGAGLKGVHLNLALWRFFDRWGLLHDRHQLLIGQSSTEGERKKSVCD